MLKVVRDALGIKEGDDALFRVQVTKPSWLGRRKLVSRSPTDLRWQAWLARPSSCLLTWWRSFEIANFQRAPNGCQPAGSAPYGFG